MGKNLGVSNDAMKASALPPQELLAELACTNTALRRASRRLGQLYDDAVAPSGLKATQVGLLAQTAGAYAGGKGEWPTLQSLAERLAVSISALTHALRPLIRDGFANYFTFWGKRIEKARPGFGKVLAYLPPVP